jgi:hypothetical protein
VAETFHQVLNALGIPETPGRPRPRLMDLRHTFAVRALETCPEGRDHVGRHILALTRLCTKSPVREMTRWSMRPSRSVFKPVLRSNRSH